MIAYNFNEDSLHTDVVWFIWYAADSARALGPDYAVSYGYDSSGRFSTVSVSNGPTFDYSYVPSSSLLSGYTNDLGLAVAYEYEPLRDLKTLVSNSWGTNPISTFAYTSDAIDRRTVRIDSSSVTNLFDYNFRSELVSAEMGTNTYAYAFDPIGNRLSSSENGHTTTYTANELNQHTALNPASPNPTPFTYDPDGNMTQYGDLAFFWDAENRLLGVASNGIALVTNRYDFMSRRIEKASSTETNDFLYDDWNLIRTEVAGNGMLKISQYIWGLDLEGTLQGVGGVGGLLLQIQSDADASMFYMGDANGNIADVVDSNGVVCARYEYDSYGNATAKSGSQAVSNPFRFSTKYCDHEVNLYYYGYRFYSPTQGRWLSRDFLEEEGSLLLYAAMLNDPVNLIDYQGLISWWECSGYCASYYLKQMMNAIEAIEALVTMTEGLMELPVKTKEFNLGTEKLTSLGNTIYKNINSALKTSRMPEVVKSTLQKVAQWAKTSGTMTGISGVRSEISAVRRFAKVGRNILRVVRGGLVAGAVISLGIESYCFTACCQQDVRNDFEYLMDTAPENFLGGGSGK